MALRIYRSPECYTFQYEEGTQPAGYEPADEKPKPTTAADLYAMSPKRHREQAAPAEKAEPAPEAPASETTAASNTVTATDGEEGGEQQA